jgi:uncharacterized membrane protein
MKVLIVLALAFVAASVVFKIFSGNWNITGSGNIAMCAMLCFTAAGHFVFSKGMEMMMPSFIPLKKEIVFLTGVIEIAGGVGLLFSQTRQLTATLLIIFFILILPANINAALKHVDLQKATTGGSGADYLWFRIPMQILLVAWVWYFGIKKG